MNSRILFLAVCVLGASLAVRAEAMFGAYSCPEGDADHAPLYRAAPVWPHVAAMMCLEGTVVLEFTVGADGRVRDAVVIDSDQPGIFDRAAIEATQRWLYRPRCEDGMPVDTQQRTALDFLFSDDELGSCLPGSKLLSGEALALAGSLGFLYSLFAEWHLNPRQADWPAQIEAAMTPKFDGDLGRIERFHHEVISELLSAYHSRPDSLEAVDPAEFTALRANLELAGIRLPEEALFDLRQLYATHAQYLEHEGHFARRGQQFSDLAAEVSLDAALLDVLVFPFLGNLRQTDAARAAWQRRQDAIEGVLSLLEDSVGLWAWRDAAIRFDLDDDQQRFERLIREWIEINQSEAEAMHGFMLGLMDYRAE